MNCSVVGPQCRSTPRNVLCVISVDETNRIDFYTNVAISLRTVQYLSITQTYSQDLIHFMHISTIVANETGLWHTCNLTSYHRSLSFALFRLHHNCAPSFMQTQWMHLESNYSYFKIHILVLHDECRGISCHKSKVLSFPLSYTCQITYKTTGFLTLSEK